MLRTLQLESRTANQFVCLARRILRPAGLAAMMFLMMRSELLLRASPMAAALMAAGLAAGESAAALAAGCLLGMLRFPLAEISLLPPISCALVITAELGLSFLPAARRAAAETHAALVAGFSVLLPALIYAGGAPRPSVQALACAALAASCAPFMLSAVTLRPDRRRLMLQEKTGAALLVGGCLAGLWQLLPQAAEGAAALLVLLLPGVGSSAGAVAGLALAAGGAGMLKTASLALCALAAGSRICTVRWQRSLAACTAAAIVQLTAGAGALGLQWMLCAAAVYLLLPEKWLRALDGLFSPQERRGCDPDRIAREVTADSRRRLRALGDAFCEMAEGCAAPTGVPDEQELICEMRNRLCGGCPGYGDCWAGEDNRGVRLLCRLLADALDRVDAPPGMRVLFSDGEIPPDVLRACRRGRMIPDRLGLLLRDFAEKRRSEIKRCTTGQLMSVQFMQAREILYNLAGRQEEPVSLQEPRLEQLRAALDSAGLQNCDALAFGTGEAEICLSRPGGGWTREEVRRACAALNRAFSARFQPELCEGTLRFVRRPKLHAETGSSCQSGVAGEKCGDSHMVRMLDKSRLLLVVSDGMGSGDAAADESLEALRLLWRFLDAGISRPLALETVNQQLLMRSGEEMFATVDLCILDLNTGVAEFTKLAACRTLILRGQELLQVEGGQLPLGILEGVQPGISRVRLRPGDVLVMGSDGVMEAGDALMIEHLARQHAACPPEQMAETLVREAGLRRAGARRDDLTCICVRVREAG